MSSSKAIDLWRDFAAGVYLSKTQYPIPPPLHTVYVYKVYLKGPKHEIFESGLFTQIRPEREGDFGTGEKNEISQVGVFIWRFSLRKSY
jgi:hypothetical protein